jgi:hypothetical protein
MGSRFFWLSFGGALLVTTLSAWVSWEFFIKPMDAAIHTANLLHEKFQESLGLTPRILANAGVLDSQKSELESLTLSSGDGSVRESFAGQRPGGGDFAASADFRAQAGFFFREPLEINVRRGGTVADVTIPQMKILSLERMSPIVCEPADVTWDALPESLQTRVSKSLDRHAKREILDAGLLKRAENELQKKVRQIAMTAGCEVVFTSPP